MAQLRTTNGGLFDVKETKEEIDSIIGTPECMETGIIKLNWGVTITSWESGEEKDRRQYEPVSFIRSNIIMYYN